MHHNTWTYRTVNRRIKRPMKSLRFLEFRFENGEDISFRAQDILSLEIKHPVLEYPHFLGFDCYFASEGTRIILSSGANNKDRYKSWFSYDSVFNRFLEYSDIKQINLIYDERYWKKETCDREISVKLPYRSKKPYGWEENKLQTAWMDRNSCLHIEIAMGMSWICECRSILANGKIYHFHCI